MVDKSIDNQSCGFFDNDSMTLVSEKKDPWQDIVSQENGNEAVDDCSKVDNWTREDSEEEEINTNLQNSFVNKNKYCVFWSCLFHL